MKTIKLIKKVFISGEIEALTGLHIGSKNIGLSIGSTDNTVIRHPVTQEPYIPGSSLRGKMRSLIERFQGRFGHKPMSEAIKRGPYVGGEDGKGIDHYICKVFGVPADEAQKYDIPPSRLLVRDGHLMPGPESEPGSVEWLKNAKNTDMPFTEVKTEVVIDRVTSAAMPRPLERVPAGARFSLNMVLNIWEEDKTREAEFIKAIFDGLKLLQDDYLGGHGSRGSGRVKVRLHPLKERNLAYYQNGEAEIERADIIIPDELKFLTHPTAGAAPVVENVVNTSETSK